MTVRVGWAGPGAPLLTCRPTFKGWPPLSDLAQSEPVHAMRPDATLQVMPHEFATDFAPASGHETDQVAWADAELMTSWAT